MIASILASGLAADVALRLLMKTLVGALHVGPVVAQAAAMLALSKPLRPQVTEPTMIGLQVTTIATERSTGIAEAAENESAPTWRAAYMLAAARRIDERMGRGQTLEQATAAESTYAQMHVDAQRRRREAAQAVDAAADVYGLQLGWYANGDERTTPECAWANGRNFMADRRPVFGWPGAVHPRCRCTAGLAFPNGRLLYVAPARLLNSH